MADSQQQPTFSDTSIINYSLSYNLIYCTFKTGKQSTETSFGTGKQSKQTSFSRVKQSKSTSFNTEKQLKQTSFSARKQSRERFFEDEEEAELTGTLEDLEDFHDVLEKQMQKPEFAENMHRYYTNELFHF